MIGLPVSLKVGDVFFQEIKHVLVILIQPESPVGLEAVIGTGPQGQSVILVKNKPGTALDTDPVCRQALLSPDTKVTGRVIRSNMEK